MKGLKFAAGLLTAALALTAAGEASSGQPSRPGGPIGNAGVRHSGQYAGAGHVGHYAGARHFGHYAGHGHWHSRVYIGVPLSFGWSYPPVPYYYPPPVYYPPVATVPPPVYVERADMPAAPPAEAWWYFCESSNAYYPYVRDCPGGWAKVAPAPPPR